MKQILIYSPIFSFTAEQFIDKMSALDKKEPVTMRVNSPGGSVFAGWGMIRTMQEHQGEITYKVDGIAASMAFYMGLFAGKVEALDVSRFLIHRADGYVENDDDKKELSNINAIIRKHLEKRVNKDIFQQVTGVSIDEVFAEDKRKDVWVSAKQAKEMGLVDKIVRLEPKEIAAMNETFLMFSDMSQGSGTAQGGAAEKNDNSNNQKFKKMTIQELKAQHPELYEQVEAIGVEAGKKAEQIRAKSWMAYLEIDKENVIAAIKEGKEFTTDVISEMAVKMHAAATKAKIEGDSAGDLGTGKPNDKTAEQKEVEAFEKEVMDGVKQINPY